MARTQALDYANKRQKIKDAAALLIARNGFHNTSITDIAARCKTSKSRLYHYFESKEQLLFELLEEHAETLSQLSDQILNDPQTSPEDRLRDYAIALLRINITSRAKHAIILSELDRLPRKQTKKISTLLRRPIEALFETLGEINPALQQNETMQFSSAMMFMGMLNWTHTWFDQAGALTVEQFADMACNTFLSGFGTLELPHKATAELTKLEQ